MMIIDLFNCLINVMGAFTVFLTVKQPLTHVFINCKSTVSVIMVIVVWLKCYP